MRTLLGKSKSRCGHDKMSAPLEQPAEQCGRHRRRRFTANFDNGWNCLVPSGSATFPTNQATFKYGSAPHRMAVRLICLLKSRSRLPGETQVACRARLKSHGKLFGCSWSRSARGTYWLLGQACGQPASVVRVFELNLQVDEHSGVANAAIGFRTHGSR